MSKQFCEHLDAGWFYFLSDIYDFLGEGEGSIVHNCTIFLCSLDVRDIDDQCRGPSTKEKGHLAGKPTRGHCANRNYLSQALRTH